MRRKGRLSCRDVTKEKAVSSSVLPCFESTRESAGEEDGLLGTWAVDRGSV